MDLDELRSVQSRERQTDSLQQLRESFYRDAGEFIQQLHRERDRAAEQADDPWNAPEVNRLNDDIDTAEGTVEAIYERRVGKLVKMASLAAADMPTEDEGLTAEERQLFETLVDAIETNRAQVEAILDGDDPSSVPTTDPVDAGAGSPVDTGTAPTGDDGSAAQTDDERASVEGSDRDAVPPEPPADDLTRGGDDAPEPSSAAAGDDGGIDAADLMAGDGPTETAGTDPSDSSGADANPDAPPEPPEPPAPPAAQDETTSGTDGSDQASSVSGDGSDDAEPAEPAPDGDEGDESTPTVDRATVRITADVGEIFGVDERAYDLTEEDVVTLPEANAGPLVDRDAAERLD